MNFDFDMIVIGGGAAGLTSAGMSASLGAKTALIELHKLGGDCTWTGCVPSKTLLKAAKIFYQSKTARNFGLENYNVQLNFKNVAEHIKNIQQKVYEEADDPKIYEKMGVEVITGNARFIDKNRIEIIKETNESKILSSRYFIISTGASPVVPDINGISEINYLTNHNIFSLNELPKKLAIVGAGPIGIEMAQAFNRLGSKITVIDLGNKILSKDNEELTSILLEELKKEGIVFRFEESVIEIKQNSSNKTIFLKNNITGAASEVNCNEILISAGRKPNIKGLNLEGISLHTNNRGIVINKNCRTNIKNIYACGDVAGSFQFTHFAEHMAKVAVSNALLHLPLSIDTKNISWCTFSEPELAHVGATEKQLLDDNINYTTYKFPFNKIDRAITENETVGWIKVYAKSWNGKIFGVDILGANAGEMIGEFALAVKNGITLRKIAETIHPYPTYILGNRRAADQWFIKKQSRLFVKALQTIFNYKGSLPDTSDPDRII